MMDVGFYRYLYQRNQYCSGRSTAVSRRDRTACSWLVEGMMISCLSNLVYYEKVGETVNGGIYSFVDNFIYSPIIISG